MVMPGLSFISKDYRYGFNGQEKDDEIKGEGNSLHFTFRYYDPRLGRFFAVDPLTKGYPQWTPYQFAGNQVISSRELEGLEPDVDLNAKVGLTATLGTRKQSSFRLNAAFGVSIGGGNAQANLNVGGNLYNGGVGTTQGTLGKTQMQGDLVISPSITAGGGQGENLPINTFNGQSLSGVNSDIKYSLNVGTNFVFNTDGRNQRVGSIGGRIGDFSLNTYNDFYPGGDANDRWHTGGGQASYNFGSGTSLTFGTEVFTGERTGSPSGYNNFSARGNKFYQQSPGGANLTNGQTFLQLNTSNGVGIRATTTGRGLHDSMWSQNQIHDKYPLPRFNTFAKQSFQFGIGVGQ